MNCSSITAWCQRVELDQFSCPAHSFRSLCKLVRRKSCTNHATASYQL